MKDNANRRLSSDSVSKLIWQFSLPAIIGQVVFALYNIVDRMFIGRELGSLAIASISVTLPIFTIITAMGMLVSFGASTMVSISLGEGKKSKAEKILGNAVFAYFICNIFIMFLGYVFMDEILKLVGASESMLEMASEYMSVIYFFILFQFLAIGANGIIRSEGSPKKAMTIMLISAIMNIILDYFFVMVFDWGIQGAAVATKLSTFTAACLTVYHFTKSKQRILTLKWSNIIPDKHIMTSILKVGFPGFILQIGVSLTFALANGELYEYGGEMAIGAMGVISSIYMAAMYINMGIGQGVQPLIGYNYGQKLYHRVSEILKKSLTAATIISLIIFIPIYFTPATIVSFFSDGDTAFVDMTVRGMNLYLMGIPLLGCNVIGSGYYQSVGKSKQAGMLYFLKQIVFYLGALLILPFFFNLDGVFASGAVAEILLFIILIFFMIKEKKILKIAGCKQEMLHLVVQDK